MPDLTPPARRRARTARSRLPAGPAPVGLLTDVLYVAWNRLEFTRASFELLAANTDWSLVRRLIVIDDGSDDGTAEYLDAESGKLSDDLGIASAFVQTARLGPPGLMNYYLSHWAGGADVFAKIDNDIAVPPGWLPTMLDVYGRGGVELLGMEAGRTAVPGRNDLGQDGPFDGRYGVEPCSHIGGVGVMSVAAFHTRPRIAERGRFGFTEWQGLYEPLRAWIRPDLLVPQLDRVPLEPWRSLSREYVGRGWQREWPDYSPQWMIPYFDWLPGAQAALAAGEEPA